MNEERQSYNQRVKENLKFHPRIWDKPAFPGAPFHQQLERLQLRGSEKVQMSLLKCPQMIWLHFHEACLQRGRISSSFMVQITNTVQTLVWSKGQPRHCY